MFLCGKSAKPESIHALGSLVVQVGIDFGKANAIVTIRYDVYHDPLLWLVYGMVYGSQGLPHYPLVN
jgi:hypothetical protein